MMEAVVVMINVEHASSVCSMHHWNRIREFTE